MADISQYKDLNLVMAEITDCLWDKLELIAAELTKLMRESNLHPGSIAAEEAEDHIKGIKFVLDTLEIPFQVHLGARRTGRVAPYSYIEIAGRTFWVDGQVQAI